MSVVFAPHPDDETLGCGGAILQKRRQGSPVKVVFLSDGRHSHSHLLPAEQLAGMRRQEAVEACLALGVERDDIHFLNCEDGQLAGAVPFLVETIAALFRLFRPAELYIPYRGEPPADHAAANRAVRAAAFQAGLAAVVYEYPVWAWYHWPWVPINQNSRAEIRKVIRNTLQMQFGRRILADFQTSVPVQPVLAQKRAALEAHRSQMFRWQLNKDWQTLADVSAGSFLNLFFRDREYFYAYRLRPGVAQSSGWRDSHA